MGLAATSIAVWSTARARDDDVEVAFDRTVNGVVARLGDEVSRYQLIAAAIGSFATVAESGVDVADFLAPLAPSANSFNALAGVAFVESVPPERLDTFTARMREAGHTDFAPTERDGSDLQGHRAYVTFSIVLGDPPVARAPKPAGTDAFADARLLKALLEARSLGTRFTAVPILERPEAGALAGDGQAIGDDEVVAIVDTVAPDGVTLGWVVVFIDAAELLEASIGSDSPVAVEIGLEGAAQPLAATGTAARGEPARRETIDVLGSHFSVKVSGGPGFSRAASGTLPPTTLLVVGTLATVLFAIGAWLISSSLDRRRRVRAIRHLATHDALTDLPNRDLLLEHLDDALANGRRTGAMTAVCYVNLDRFKIVNNTLGHDAGDAVLLEVAARLRALVGDDDTVARIGGDEFAVLARAIDSTGKANQLGQCIVVALGRPIETSGGAVRVGGSVGIAIAPVDTHDTDELVRFAESAMRRAKAEGEGRAVRFDDVARDRVVARRDTEAALAQAVSDDQLEAFFQPFVAVDDARVVAYEALVRWAHPERGLLSPAQFLPDAESSGAIVDIDRWMCRESVRRAASWNADGFGSATVWVNASVRSLVQADFATTVRHALEEFHLDASCLGIEVDETVLDIDPEIAARALGPIRDLGVRVALDDFGGGSSSLSVLRRVPIDLLKLDRSLVEPLGTGPEPEKLVSAVVSMAHSLGITVIAEGIETIEQRDAAERCGCDLVQGYLYARPQPIDEITRARRRGSTVSNVRR